MASAVLAGGGARQDDWRQPAEPAVLRLASRGSPGVRRDEAGVGAGMHLFPGGHSKLQFFWEGASIPAAPAGGPDPLLPPTHVQLHRTLVERVFGAPVTSWSWSMGGRGWALIHSLGPISGGLLCSGSPSSPAHPPLHASSLRAPFRISHWAPRGDLSHDWAAGTSYLDELVRPNAKAGPPTTPQAATGPPCAVRPSLQTGAWRAAPAPGRAAGPR